MTPYGIEFQKWLDNNYPLTEEQKDKVKAFIRLIPEHCTTKEQSEILSHIESMIQSMLYSNAASEFPKDTDSHE